MQAHKPSKKTPLALGSYLMVFFGFCASAYIGLEVQKIEDQKVEAQFTRSVDQYFGAIDRQFKEDLLLVRSLESFLLSATDIDQDSFSRFVRPLLGHYPGVQALEWSPKVSLSQIQAFTKKARLSYPQFFVKEKTPQGEVIPAQERSFYYPVFLVEPLAGNEAAVGFDVFSNPERAATIDKSISTNDIAVSPRIRLIQEKGSQNGILAIAPVINSRQNSSNGVVIGVFRVGDVVSAAVKNMDFLGLDISIYEGDQNTGSSNIFNHSSNKSFDGSIGAIAYFNQAFSLSQTRVLQVGDRQWTLKFVPSESSYIAYGQLVGLLAAALGFAMTLLLAWIYQSKKLLRVRNRQLVAVNHQISGLLNNIQYGVLTVGPDLVVHPEYSRACLSIFDQSPALQHIGSLLFNHDEKTRQHLTKTLENLFHEKRVSRQKLYISLLPKEVSFSGKVLGIDYIVLANEIMFVFSDITEEKGLEQNLHREVRRLQIIVSAVKDSADLFAAVDLFRQFVSEGRGRQISSHFLRIYHDVMRIQRANVATSHHLHPTRAYNIAFFSALDKLKEVSLPNPDPRLEQEYERCYRFIHTYKGVFNQLGFYHLPQALHEVESGLSQLAQSNCLPLMSDYVYSIDWLQLLNRDLQSLNDVFGDEFIGQKGFVTITPAQAAQIKNCALRLIDLTHPEGVELETLLDLTKITNISFLSKLREFDALVARAALALCKDVAPLAVEGDDILINTHDLHNFFFTLGHVFRNAVDHGIEAPDLRILRGKDSFGHISCVVQKQEGGLALTISDDGAGIDQEMLREKLTMKYGRHFDNATLEDLIFSNGASSKEEVSEWSGRGVGMGAVRQVTLELGGSISVSTTPGQGTQFTFTLPIS